MNSEKVYKDSPHEKQETILDRSADFGNLSHCIPLCNVPISDSFNQDLDFARLAYHVFLSLLAHVFDWDPFDRLFDSSIDKKTKE